MFPMLVPQVFRIDGSYDKGRYDDTDCCKSFTSQLASSGRSTICRVSAKDLEQIL